MRLKPEAAGRRIKCPSCQAALAVPPVAPQTNPIAAYTVRTNLLGRKSVKFSCPGCTADLNSPLSDAGQGDKCPDCMIEFVVPGVAEREADEKEAGERRDAQEAEASERRAKADALRQERDKAAEHRRTERERQRREGEELHPGPGIASMLSPRRVSLPGGGDAKQSFALPDKREYPNLRAICTVMRVAGLLTAAFGLIIMGVSLFNYFSDDTITEASLLLAISTLVLSVLAGIVFVAAAESIRIALDVQENTLTVARAAVQILDAVESRAETEDKQINR